MRLALLALLLCCSCSVLGHAESAAIDHVSADLTRAARPVASAAASAAVQGAGAAALPFEVDALAKIEREEQLLATDLEARIDRERRLAVAALHRAGDELVERAAARADGLVEVGVLRFEDAASRQRAGILADLDAGVAVLEAAIARQREAARADAVAVVDHSARTAQHRAELVAESATHDGIWLAGGSAVALAAAGAIDLLIRAWLARRAKA